MAVVPAIGMRVDAQGQTFHVDAHAVLVYASVANKAGLYVPGLTPDDFEVKDNGRKQTLTAFSAELQPITAVLMLDRSGSGPRPRLRPEELVRAESALRSWKISLTGH